MRTTAIIPCAGDASRWHRHFGVEKQLTLLDGGRETLLGRTIRLLREYGVDDVVVVTRKPEIRDAAARAVCLTPSNNTYLSDTLLSSRDLWSEKTVVLLGDIYFSEEALGEILDDGAAVRFYGLCRESPPVRFLGARCEIFGFGFSSRETDAVVRALWMNSALAGLRDAGPLGFFWTPKRMKYLAGLAPGNSGLDLKRRELLRLYLRYGCWPIRPRLLRSLGPGRSRVWMALRGVRAKMRGDARRFGKLWGTYMLMAGINPVDRDVKSRPPEEDSLFKEISGYAQDIDLPEDYERLRLVLDLIEEGEGLHPVDWGDRQVSETVS